MPRSCTSVHLRPYTVAPPQPYKSPAQPSRRGRPVPVQSSLTSSESSATGKCCRPALPHASLRDLRAAALRVRVHRLRTYVLPLYEYECPDSGLTCCPSTSYECVNS